MRRLILKYYKWSDECTQNCCLAQEQNSDIISGGDDVTDVCDRCGYKERCIELGLDLDCQDECECSNYDTFVEEDENDEEF